MAGHSHFKNVMRRKGAQDAKKGKILTKVQREIIAACKGGSGDPATNPRLRAAVQWAREENMPRDRIEAAIKRGSGAGNESENYKPIRYEGYGPGGTALIVQALTDNLNRTAPEMRSAFLKYGGNLGETGSVSFMFDHVGFIVYPLPTAGEEAMFEASLEAGADNCETDGEQHSITTSIEGFIGVRDALEKKFGAAQSAKFTWLPKNTVSVSDEHATSLLKLIDVLEDNDDVQEVFSNFEISEALAEKLSA
ncbi:MAG: YebC/PmpR family DNA-binding transcriptional regulator [Alphaproteobacteria bacterium]|nr:YebC/PmpR family DNA-binding transcriptional regulator [Alphaproteobacteria bacterium]